VSDKPLVVLVGPPAAGKTRVAKRLGKHFGVGVIDTDSVVVERWGSIPTIFESQGEPFFREQERHAVIEALRSTGIVALGGGAVMNPGTRADLANHRVALITISPESVEPRLNNSKRPLLVGGIESWKELVAARADTYDAVASQTFDASHQSVDSLTEEIIEWLREDAGL
jgi:shikimate kinase